MQCYTFACIGDDCTVPAREWRCGVCNARFEEINITKFPWLSIQYVHVESRKVCLASIIAFKGESSKSLDFRYFISILDAHWLSSEILSAVAIFI
jgi:hypothetical protein